MNQELRGALKQDRARYNSRMYDSHNVRVSLKQWRMLLAVVDNDGFSGAANCLHLSQSAISYTMSRLQEQLGIPLLRIEGRKARITKEGRAVLEKSRQLLKFALELEALTIDLRLGLGTEVRLAIDSNFPSHLLMNGLRRFQAAGPNVRVCVSEADVFEAESALRERRVDLAISSHVPEGFIGSHLLEVERVPVAHPAHALFMLKRKVSGEDLDRQVQIVVPNSSQSTSILGHEKPGNHVRCWRVRSFDLAIGALLASLGYAWLPLHRVQSLLDRNELAILPLDGQHSYKTNLYLIKARASADLGVMRLVEALSDIPTSGQAPA